MSLSPNAREFIRGRRGTKVVKLLEQCLPADLVREVFDYYAPLVSNCTVSYLETDGVGMYDVDMAMYAIFHDAIESHRIVWFAARIGELRLLRMLEDKDVLARGELDEAIHIARTHGHRDVELYLERRK